MLDLFTVYVENYVWYKSLHKNNVTIEAHWLLFPTPSLVRAVPSLCIALATSVVHESENRRARSSDLEMAYFTRQAIRPKGYYAAMRAAARTSTRIRRPPLFAVQTSTQSRGLSRSLSSCGRTIQRKTPPWFWRRI